MQTVALPFDGETAEKKGGGADIMLMTAFLEEHEPLPANLADELLRKAERPVNPFDVCGKCERLTCQSPGSEDLAFCAHCQSAARLIRKGSRIAESATDGRLWECMRRGILLDMQPRTSKKGKPLKPRRSNLNGNTGHAGGFLVAVTNPCSLADAYRAARHGHLLLKTGKADSSGWRVVLRAEPIAAPVFAQQPAAKPAKAQRKKTTRKPQGAAATT